MFLRLSVVLRAAVTSAFAGVVLWACGSDSAHPSAPALTPTVPVTSTPVPPAPSASPIVEIWVEGGYPAARLTVDSLEQNVQTGRVARGRAADGTVRDVEVQWTSSDTAIVKLDRTSSATTIAVVTRKVGSVTITARLDTLQGAFTLVVTPQRVRQVIIQHAPIGDSPFAGYVLQPDSLIVRTTARYVGECQTWSSSKLAGIPLVWRTSDTTRATVDSTGTVTARSVGPVRLKASCTGVLGEVVDTSVQLVVRPPRAARLAFTYVPDSLILNHTDSVRAVLYDSAGQATAIPARIEVTTWGMFGTGVSNNSQIRRLYLGTVDVQASGDGLTVHHPLRVYPVPAGPPQAYPAALALVPNTRALLAGYAADYDGKVLLGGSAPTYASADPTIASVSDSGVVTARNVGNTTIRLRTGTLQTDVPVTVVAPNAFHMDVLPATARPLPATLASALTQATHLWEAAILNDLPDVRITLPPDVCGLAAPPTEELVIDDMLVFVSVDSLDGRDGVLAQGGPCVIRSDGTTIVGRIQVDSADLASLASSGQLVTVVQHELGHVLGIGTLWNRSSLGFVSKSGTDWGYHGPRGLRVGTLWGRTNPAGVWLGEAGGPGAGHWHEGMFTSELMTPVLNAGANPLSLLTLEALSDLGYLTSAAAADSYASYPNVGPPSLRANRVGLPTAARVPFDRVLQPRWRVVGQGRLQRVGP